MMLWQPLDEEIQAALARLRSHPIAPARPVPHQAPKSKHADDVGIGSVLDEPHGRPISIQAPEHKVPG